MTTEEANMLRMKYCKENIWTFIRRMLENKNKQRDKGHVTRGRYCEIYKSTLTEMYGHVERMQNQIMPKQIATATMEGTNKRGRQYKRKRD